MLTQFSLCFFFFFFNQLLNLGTTQGGVGWKWSRWQPLMYLPRTVMNSPSENKPITSSSIGLVFLLPAFLFLLPFLIGIRCSLLSGLPSQNFIPGRGLLLFHTSASRGPPLPLAPALIDRPSLPSELPPPQRFFLPSFPLFFFLFCLFSAPPLLPPSLHPSHWVMAIRAGSRPAAVGDRHWSHTQSLGAEGEAIHPFCARRPLRPHSGPYCTFAGRSNYRRPDCRMKQIKLKGEYAELLIHYLVSLCMCVCLCSLGWGLAFYILGQFITEIGPPKLRHQTAFVTHTGRKWHESRQQFLSFTEAKRSDEKRKAEEKM